MTPAVAATDSCVIEAFKPVTKNTLRGFARVRFPSGLIIDEVSVHVAVADGKTWASPPGRPMIDRDGHAMRDAEGRVRYSSLITFSTARVRTAWSDAVIEAIRSKHPEALA